MTTFFLLLFLVDERREDPNTAISGPLLASKTPLKLCADDGPTLNSGLLAFEIFQAIRTSIAKKLHIFVIFPGEVS